MPNRAYFLLPIGWLSAAALHAAWDSVGVVVDSDFAFILTTALIALLSYALLAGAIFRAREISPRAAANAPRPEAPTSSDWD
jgi:RsiW-degrading membrane proteinase PrsW (M82 family)